MRVRETGVLIRREYLAKVKNKVFWISTLVLPILMAGLMIVPSLMIAKTGSTERMVVVDTTGKVAPLLLEEIAERQGDRSTPGQRSDVGQTFFDLEAEPVQSDWEAQRAELDRRVLDGELDAWLWISQEALDEDQVEFRGEKLSGVVSQSILERAISAAVRELRFSDAGLDSERIAELSRSVSLETFRVTADGGRAEAGLSSAMLAYVFGFLLYMTFLIYGSQVLTAVLEEKSSRVVEVMLSCVKPTELMMSKLVGTCLAGLTQLTVWVSAMVVLTAPGFLALLPNLPMENIPRVPLSLLFHLLAFFVLGFFVIATIYGALGAAFNNVGEAQQLAVIPMMMVIVPLMLMFAVINAPDSTLAVVGSLFPPFTPMLMTVRLATSSPPWWQVVMGYVGAIGFAALMVWFAARIYRVGILMYGKKPTPGEILRWLRYA